MNRDPHRVTASWKWLHCRNVDICGILSVQCAVLVESGIAPVRMVFPWFCSECDISFCFRPYSRSCFLLSFYIIPFCPCLFFSASVFVLFYLAYVHHAITTGSLGDQIVRQSINQIRHGVWFPVSAVRYGTRLDDFATHRGVTKIFRPLQG